ncbi:MAG: arginine biosynthesis protein ArgJ [Spirochaetes bacterium]|jgi:glutamate N-acetyltransferase/amino-acid N-acetyltransferase|nr:arginine biosynthesis protein ArgJ [Spirochaetota bacterium]
MAPWNNPSEYRHELERRGPWPRGFHAGTTSIRFIPGERPTESAYEMNLALIAADEPVEAFAAVFTKNAFPGAPVILGRRQLDERTLQGIVVNNKISNVCSPTGLADARRLAEAAGRLYATASAPAPFLSVSTGIIGWALPVDEMLAALQALRPAAPVDVAEAIMTTDSYPKVRSAEVPASGAGGRIVGIAKGAGMVEPNLATMLVFLVTDIDVERDDLREDLRTVVDASFNTISIDSDQSTSDSVLAWSSKRVAGVSRPDFRDALHDVCAGLAEDIVRNGEGVGHVIRVRVGSAPSRSVAAALGKAIVNSPLVKTAICGNDPNVGRIVAALGDAAGNSGIALDPERTRVTLGAETIFADGAFHLDRDKEQRLCDYLEDAAMDPGIEGFPQHDRIVDIGVDVAMGSSEERVLGSDLSHEYIRKNADYRT